jgi:hypothetical protein
MEGVVLERKVLVERWYLIDNAEYSNQDTGGLLGSTAREGGRVPRVRDGILTLL